jgi:hypothetical protein
MQLPLSEDRALNGRDPFLRFYGINNVQMPNSLVKTFAAFFSGDDFKSFDSNNISAATDFFVRNEHSTIGADFETL